MRNTTLLTKLLVSVSAFVTLNCATSEAQSSAAGNSHIIERAGWESLSSTQQGLRENVRRELVQKLPDNMLLKDTILKTSEASRKSTMIRKYKDGRNSNVIISSDSRFGLQELPFTQSNGIKPSDILNSIRSRLAEHDQKIVKSEQLTSIDEQTQKAQQDLKSEQLSIDEQTQKAQQDLKSEQLSIDEQIQKAQQGLKSHIKELEKHRKKLMDAQDSCSQTYESYLDVIDRLNKRYNFDEEKKIRPIFDPIEQDGSESWGKLEGEETLSLINARQSASEKKLALDKATADLEKVKQEQQVVGLQISLDKLKQKRAEEEQRTQLENKQKSQRSSLISEERKQAWGQKTADEAIALERMKAERPFRTKVRVQKETQITLFKAVEQLQAKVDEMLQSNPDLIKAINEGRTASPPPLECPALSAPELHAMKYSADLAIKPVKSTESVHVVASTEDESEGSNVDGKDSLPQWVKDAYNKQAQVRKEKLQQQEAQIEAEVSQNLIVTAEDVGREKEKYNKAKNLKDQEIKALQENIRENLQKEITEIQAQEQQIQEEARNRGEFQETWEKDESDRIKKINKDLTKTIEDLKDKIKMLRNALRAKSTKLEHLIASEENDFDDEDANPASPKNPVTSGFRAPPSSPVPAGSISVYQEAEEEFVNPETTEAVLFDLSHVEEDEGVDNEKPEVTRQSTFTSVNNSLKAISSMSHWTEFVTEFVDESNPAIAVTGEVKKHASASPVEVAKVTTSVVSDVNEIARIVKERPDTIGDLTKVAGDINPDRVNINDIFTKMHDAGIDPDKTGLDKDLVTILRNHRGDLSHSSNEVLASQTPEQNKLTMALNLANMSSTERDEIKEKMNKDVTSLVKLDVATLVHRKVMAKFNVNGLNLEGNGISAGGLAAGDEEDTSRARFKGIWVSGLYGINQQDPVDRKVGYKGIVSGVTVGTDFTIGENSTVGVAYSHLDSGFKFGQEKTGDKVNASSNVFSLYGQTIVHDNIIFQSVLSYLKSQIKSTSKRLVAPGTYRIANGKYNSNSLNAELLVNYKYDNGKGFILIPNVGLKFGRNRDGGYNENGAGLYDLSIASRKQNSLTGIAGVKLMMPKKLSDNTELIPSLSASVETILRQHQEDVNVKLKWLGQDSNHEVHIPKSGNIGYNFGGGLMLKHKNTELLATYNYHTRKKYRSHQGSLKLQLLF